MSNLSPRFSARNCGWAVQLKLIGLARSVYCAIIFHILLLTLVVFQLIASRLSFACSWVVQWYFLPSPLYLRSSGVSSSPSIHTPSSPSYSPSTMVSLLSYSSSNTIQLSFVSIPTFSPQRPGETLWVVWDSHPFSLPQVL